jgi:hypothetical protein
LITSEIIDINNFELRIKLNSKFAIRNSQFAIIDCNALRVRHLSGISPNNDQRDVDDQNSTVNHQAQ